MEITYDSIKDIILEENFDKTNLFVKFQVEGEIFETKGSLRRDTKGTGNRVKGIVRMTVISRMRSSFNRMLRGVLGGGIVGNVGSQVSNAVVADKAADANYSKADKERAVVDAFKKIQFNFDWDKDSKKWTVARKMSDFERALKKAPLTRAYDKKILARMLLEMAKADGSIAKEEKEFFQDFLNEDTGSFAELMRSPAISRVECEEVTKEAKENVFMVTAAVALADHDFDEAERNKLNEYADMMGFRPEDSASLLKLAQDYTIETAIHSGGNMSRDEIYKFADRIGMEKSDAERVAVRLEKRMNF